ncbi:MAG TPA: hypothetical protein DEF79_10795 [Gammaproteobacteria bacterium]|nr:hypothetical protein [Gammaproteobacteria bacterium]
MPEQLDALVDNVLKASVWVRVLFVIGFIVVLHLIIGPLILLLALAQGLFFIFTAKVNENLAGFGALLAAYVGQILHFVTFNSDRRPFPLSDFPDEQIGSAEIVSAVAEFSENRRSSSASDGVSMEGNGSDKKATKKPISKKKSVRKKKIARNGGKKAE